MPKHLNIVTVAICVLCVGLSPVLADEPKVQEESTLWTQIVTLYEQAKDAGETVSDDVYEWAKNDLETIGNWEYKVDYVPNANHIGLEKRLNELGKERWEVIWVDRQGPNLIVTMKRPSRTWLNKLPLGQLLRLAAPGGGGGGE